jgi:hypothetical protein
MDLALEHDDPPRSRISGSLTHADPAAARADGHISQEDLWIKDVTVTTGLVDTFTIPTMLDLIAAGRIDPVPFTSHRFALGEPMAAYDTFGSAAETNSRAEDILGVRPDVAVRRRRAEGTQGRRVTRSHGRVRLGSICRLVDA